MLNISQAGGTISFGVNVNPDDRLAPALPESANSQRATMQAPHGLDAQHRGELFPVNESCAAASVAPGGSFSPAMLPSLLLATREKPAADNMLRLRAR